MAANDGKKMHGKNGAIYLGNKKGVAGAVKAAVKAEWTLSLNRDYVDATVFGDTNKTYLVGLKDIQGTYSGMLDTAGDVLVSATDSDVIMVYLYADDGATPTLVAFGPALFDSSINASNTDAIRVSGNFRAATSTTYNLGWTIFSNGSL